jgi:hypothetical protein
MPAPRRSQPVALRTKGIAHAYVAYMPKAGGTLSQFLHYLRAPSLAPLCALAKVWRYLVLEESGSRGATSLQGLSIQTGPNSDTKNATNVNYITRRQCCDQSGVGWPQWSKSSQCQYSTLACVESRCAVSHVATIFLMSVVCPRLLGHRGSIRIVSVHVRYRLMHAQRSQSDRPQRNYAGASIFRCARSQ